MSSMRRAAIFFPVLVLATSVPRRRRCSQPPPAYPAVSNDIDYALADWRRLRQSDGYSFADYARFLNANPGWPGEATLRKYAEKAMRPGENAGTVLAFFQTQATDHAAAAMPALPRR